MVALEVEAVDSVVVQECLPYGLALLFIEVVVGQVQVHQMSVLAESDADLVGATLESTLP